jgi:phage terminase large subunit-like protein
LTALALLFPPHGERKNYVALLKFYMPADTLAAKERTDAGSQYTAWQRAGLITATPGDWTDYNYIIMDLLAMKLRYQIRGIAIDRAYNAAHLSQALMADGHNVVPTGQGTMTVCPAARELETLVTQKRIEHGGNQVLRWNVSNCIAKVVDDVGNIRPSKAKSTGRIDGVYALINALALNLSLRGQEATPGVMFV